MGSTVDYLIHILLHKSKISKIQGLLQTSMDVAQKTAYKYSWKKIKKHFISLSYSYAAGCQRYGLLKDTSPHI